MLMIQVKKEDEVDEKDVTENQLSCQLLILTIIHSYSNDHPLNGIVSLHVILDKIFGKDKYTCFPRNVPFEEIFRKRTLSGTH